MTESQSIFTGKKTNNSNGSKELRKQLAPFGNIIKTVNANFELFLLITVLVSILVTSIF
ncbi:hypothetical protein EV198_2722 [Roseivirga ehrenbergii]|nr:hypothetical protein EV198_2722 [Roseivirga ehrenbergii]